MKALQRVSALGLSICLLTSARGAIAFYGGDRDGREQRVASYADSGGNPTALVFDDFSLSTATSIERLFGNFSSGVESTPRSDRGILEGLPIILGAYYEIWSAVDTSQPVMYGNLSSVTSVATGRTVNGKEEFQVAGSLTPTLLPAGNYWVAIAPASSGLLMVTVTGPGFNGVGSPLGNGNSYVSSVATDYSKWGPIDSDDVLGQGYWDFSYGIEGTPVPEPSTFIAGALLALPFGVQGWRYLRNRKRSA